MSSFQVMLDQALNPYKGSTTSAAPAVTGPAPNYYQMAANAATGTVDPSTQSQLEVDLHTLSPLDFEKKYGPATDQILTDYARGHASYHQDMSSDRSAGQILSDNLAGAGGLTVSSILGALSMGMGLVSPTTGAMAGQAANDLDNWVRTNLQSDPLQLHRRAAEARQEILNLQSEKAYQADIAHGEDPLVAKFSRFGRGLLNSVKTAAADPMLLEEGTADNAGAILVNYLLTAGMGEVAEAIAPGTKAAVTAARAAEASGAVAKPTIGLAVTKAIPMASQGVQMGGMAYQQAVGEVLGKSFEELEQNSEVYRNAYDKYRSFGLSDADAKQEARYYTAGIAGRQASLIAAPLAAATAHISHLSEHPFEVKSLPSSAADVLVKQPLEGGLVNATQTLAQNMALKDTVDPTRELDTNLGGAAGEGAIYGLTAAGALQAPGLALRGATEVAKGTAKGTVLALNHLFSGAADRVAEEAQKASPVSAENMTRDADVAVHGAPVDAATAQTDMEVNKVAQPVMEKVTNFVNGFHEALAFDPAKEGITENTPAFIREPLENASNRVHAIVNLAQDLMSETDPRKKVLLASVLHEQIEKLEPYRHVSEEIMQNIPPDSDTHKILRAYQNIATNVENITEVKKAKADVHSFFEQREATQPVEEKELNTPEGNRKIHDVITNAHLAPDTGNAEAIASVLTHAENGKLELSDRQRQILQGSKVLLDARQQLIDDQIARGIKPSVAESVSKQILNASPEKGKPSTAQHFQMIFDALRSGDIEGAKKKLADMGLFAQHMGNKVEALNTSYKNGDGKGVSYEALSPERAGQERHWYTAEGKLAVTPFKEGSIEFAQRVHDDQMTLNRVHSGLVDAFPELGGKKVTPTQLHADLIGNPKDVATEFKNGTRKVPDVQTPADIKTEATKAVPQTQVENPVQVEKPVVEKVPAQEPEPVQKVEAPPTKVEEPVVEKPAAPKYMQEGEVHLASVTTDKGTKLELGITHDGDTHTVTAYTPEGETAGMASFQLNAEGHPVADSVMTMEDFKRQGVASAIYDAAEKYFGKEAVPSDNQDADGKAFWEARNAKKGATETTTPITETTADPTIEDQLPDHFSTGSEEEAQPVIEAKPKLEHIFTKLVNTTKNMFLDAFGLREEPSTRTLKSESPSDDVRKALTSDKSLREFGAKVKRTLTSEVAKVYQQLLAKPSTEEAKALAARYKTGKMDGAFGLAPLMVAMHGQLQDFLGKSYKGKTIAEHLRSGELEVNRWGNSKVLNLVEPMGDTFRYNPNLLEHAAMASLNWFLTIGHAAPQIEDGAIERITKGALDPSSPEYQILKTSFSVEDVKQGIANAIKQFWGTTTPASTDIAYGDGIAESMAAELMRAMQSTGMFDVQKIDLDLNGDGKTDKSFNRFVPNADLVKSEEVKTLLEYPGAMADAVMTNPPQIFHFGGDEKLEAPQYQMHSDTQNTKAQKKAIENANKTKYYLDMPMVNLNYALGMEKILDLFGGGNGVEDDENVNAAHKDTLIGKNVTVRSAATHLVNMINQMRNHALTTGEDLAEIENHYEHNMSRVGRMQQLGGQTPQASKFIREVMLPTWSVLDPINNPDHYKAWWLATAQALGIKIETMTPEKAAAQARAMLDEGGKFAPIMDILTDWVNEQNENNTLHTDPGREMVGSGIGDELHEAFQQIGEQPTPVMLHALLENARFGMATPEEQSAFRTSLYLEADGKTNGPINSMVMLGNGLFTPAWLQNTAKGGLSIGPDARAMHSLDQVDLYKTAAAKAETYARERINSFKASKNAEHVTPISDSLLALMHEFLPGFSMTTDEKGNQTLSLDRKVAKNPLTITIYGSGEEGIAGKLVSNMMDAIYERMTAGLRAETQEEALQKMFPKAEDPKAAYREFIKNLNTVLGDQILQNNMTGEFFTKNATKDKVNHPDYTSLRPESFKLDSKEFKTLQNNMHQVLVKPLVKAIGDTVGPEVMAASKLIQAASNRQSVIYSEFIKNAIEQRLAERAANDPTYRKGDFISREDMRQILKDAAPLAPLATGDDQNIMMTKSANYSNDDLHYSKALNDQFGTAADIDVPGAAGVAGMPFMIIGKGDGHMMQNIFGVSGEGIMDVFDGLHMPLDKIDTIGRYANKAAYEAWMNNPAKSVRDAYMGMLQRSEMIHKILADQYEAAVAAHESGKFSSLEKAMDAKMTLAQALLKGDLEQRTIHDFANNTDLHNTLIHDVLLSDAYALNDLSRSIDARHTVLQTVGMSADQMAGAEAPFHNGMSGEVDMASPEDTARGLNDVYSRALRAQDNITIPEPIDHEAYLKERGETSTLPTETLETENTPDYRQVDDMTPEVDNAPVPQSTTDFSQPVEAEETPERKLLRDVVQTVGRGDKETGVRVLSPTAIRNLARKLPLTDNQKAILSQIFRAGGTKEYKIVTGTAEQLSAYAKKMGSATLQDMVGKDGKLNGYISTGEKTIYLINPSAETLAHELVHAATYDTILNHYTGNGEVRPETAEAIGRLEKLMEQFMAGEAPKDTPQELLRAVTNARAAIDNARFGTGDSAVQKAKALNEFMAWTLSNKALADRLKVAPANKFVLLAKEVIKALKTMFWGKQRAGQVKDDMFSNIQFNTGIVMRDRPTITSSFTDSTLHHFEQDGNSRIAAFRDSLVKNVIQHLDAMPERTEEERVDKAFAQKHFDDQVRNGEIAERVRTFFPMDINKATTFAALSAALQTHASLDPTFINRAQELYTHAIKNISVEDLMDPKAIDQEAERYYAEGRYKILMGKDESATTYDAQGRSNILPTFIALATIDDGLRQALAKIDKPGIEKSTKESWLDRVLEDTANKGLQHLSSLFSGDLRSGNVRDAMDALANRVNEHVNAECSYLAMAADKIGGVTDYINQQMVSALTVASDKGIALGDKLEASSNPTAMKIGALVKVLSSGLSDKNAGAGAEALIKTSNDLFKSKTLRDFVGDIVGRTDSNAPILDMIKQVRAVAAQVRQNYREAVPKILTSMFDRPLQDADQQHMFHGFGRTDLTSLMETNSAKDTLNLLVDPKARTLAITDLEDKIRVADPKNWEIYKAKMNQLADYMMGKKPGHNLLRNANAIAGLFGEGIKNKAEIKADVVQAIDQLTSLYAINRLGADRMKALSSLVQNESKGTEYMLNFLHSLRKNELEKVKDDSLLLHNHYKGHLPSTPEMGSSLRVANDSEMGELRLLGYHRIGDYKGDGLEGNNESMGYYLSPLNGRTAFAQGIMQNIDHTASGIDAVTGFSMKQMAGRIINEDTVKLIAGRQEAMAARYRSGKAVDMTTEHLMPVYDQNGRVFAYERSIDPKVWAMRNPSEDISKMAGVWRGRQIEEGLAREINYQLIDRTFRMYMDETSAGKGKLGDRSSEYVNLFDSTQTDRVQQDAVRLFSDDSRRYIESKFGDGQFWVRKDLVDHVIGFRQASVGDMWTGNSRWKPETQKLVRDALVSMFGQDAYKHLVQTERFIQGFTADIRRNIAVKSMMIPAMNAIDNIYQLASRGVPLASIARGIPVKLQELRLYNQHQMREIQLEADLQAASNDPIQANKIKAELQTIRDSYKRMSIAPLIERGEYSTIAGLGDQPDDVEFKSGRVFSWLEGQVSKLPEPLRVAARYGMVARDTSLFQGMERLMEYGDFIAKAVLYDDLTKRQKMDSEHALGMIQGEFGDWDRSAGRARNYSDNMGMTWFMNYKVRSAKVALSIMRNNPLHALLTAAAPAFNGTGSVFEDNLFTKGFNGSLKYSIGPGMIANGMQISPWFRLAH